MEWKNYGEVYQEICALGSTQFSRSMLMFSLSSILNSGILTDKIFDAEGLDEFCPLTEYGKIALFPLANELGLSNSEVSLLALKVFYHRDYVIDFENVNIVAVMDLIDSQVQRGNIIFPDRNGRSLYDKFAELHGGKRFKFLDYPAAKTLLNGEENGVYQIGPLVIGPLGILTSSHRRIMPPDHRLPLWHCADLGCGIIHLVELHSFDHNIVKAFAEVKSLLKVEQGPESDWEGPFSSLSRDDDGHYNDILPVLLDCFDIKEKRIIFQEAISLPSGKAIREIISSRIGKSASQGSSEAVAARLSGNQIINLLATLSNGDIIRAIDKSIFSDRIVVPKSETRKVKTVYPKRKTDLSSAISSLGIRYGKRQPASFLSTLIFQAYQRLGGEGDLAWRCKTNVASSSTVLIHMAEHGPKESISELVMPNKDIYHFVCNALNLYPDDIPEGNEENYLLWKAGFNVARYDDYLTLFRVSLSTFLDAIISLPSKANDLDRENIRAAAINAFVYAERFIEELISFSCWYLFSDHFGKTKFAYNLADATISVSEVCGSIINHGNSLFYWNNLGGNTLGTLLVYGRKLCTIIESSPQSNKALLCRLEEDYPHYATPRTGRFPFKHVQLWADADPTSLSDYSAALDEIITTLERAKTAEVRNGVQHYRDKSKFPQKAVLLDCVTLMQRSFDLADVSGYFPKQYWATTRTNDAYGIQKWTMADYNDRSIDITLPSTFVGMIKPNFATAYIVESEPILGEGASRLVFPHRENSNFSEFWGNYSNTVDTPQADDEVEVH